MRDLVERLRAQFDAWNNPPSAELPDGAGVVLEAVTRIEQLEAALRWALPLATIALEDCRQQRVKLGHTDIIGTYRNGQTWVGIHQSEVDSLEEARAALAAPSGALEERT